MYHDYQQQVKHINKIVRHECVSPSSYCSLDSLRTQILTSQSNDDDSIDERPTIENWIIEEKPRNNNNRQPSDYINDDENFLNEMKRLIHKRPKKSQQDAIILEQSNSNDISGENVKSDSTDEPKGIQLARAHWMQLHKLNLQTCTVQKMFLYVLEKYKQMRPIWQFVRYSEARISPEELLLSNCFRSHCINVQAAITLIMDNLDERHALIKLLQEFGAHHFYYDAFEWHLELICEGFMVALRSHDGIDALDERLISAWEEFWQNIFEYMGDGIEQQRYIYLTQCVTGTEIGVVQSMWAEIRERGIEIFEELLQKFGIISTAEELRVSVQKFLGFCAELLTKFDETLKLHTSTCGFTELISEMQNFKNYRLVFELCPQLVRKSFMEGFIALLNWALGETTMNESIIHTWSKIYRIHEQALISSLASNPFSGSPITMR